MTIVFVDGPHKSNSQDQHIMCPPNLILMLPCDQEGSVGRVRYGNPAALGLIRRKGVILAVYEEEKIKAIDKKI